MANIKNKTTKNTTSNKSSAKNSSSNSNSNTKKIPSFTSAIPDDRERRDGPGGN